MNIKQIIYFSLLCFSFVMFVYSWAKISEHLKKDMKWAIAFVPFSLFFDVISDSKGNLWRAINLIFAFLCIVFAVLFATEP